MGLFDLNFSDIVVTLYGDQVIGGTPPPMMTITDGMFSAQSSINNDDPFGAGTITITSAAATSEPASLSLLGLGITAAALGRKLKA